MPMAITTLPPPPAGCVAYAGAGAAVPAGGRPPIVGGAIACGAVRTVVSTAGPGGERDTGDAGAAEGGGGGGGAGAGRAAVPELAVRGGPSAAPQWTQNLVPGWLSLPQTAQLIDVRLGGA